MEKKFQDQIIGMGIMQSQRLLNFGQKEQIDYMKELNIIWIRENGLEDFFILKVK